MELPTTFVSIESIGTVAGMATAVFMVLMTTYVFGAGRDVRLWVGLGVAGLLNVLTVLSAPDILVVNIVIAFVNASLSFLGGWFLHCKAIPIWEKFNL